METSASIQTASKTPPMTSHASQGPADPRQDDNLSHHEPELSLASFFYSVMSVIHDFLPSRMEMRIVQMSFYCGDDIHDTGDPHSIPFHEEDSDNSIDIALQRQTYQYLQSIGISQPESIPISKYFHDADSFLHDFQTLLRTPLPNDASIVVSDGLRLPLPSQILQVRSAYFRCLLRPPWYPQTPVYSTPSASPTSSSLLSLSKPNASSLILSDVLEYIVTGVVTLSTSASEAAHFIAIAQLADELLLPSLQRVVSIHVARTLAINTFHHYAHAIDSLSACTTPTIPTYLLYTLCQYAAENLADICDSIASSTPTWQTVRGLWILLTVYILPHDVYHDAGGNCDGTDDVAQRATPLILPDCTPLVTLLATVVAEDSQPLSLLLRREGDMALVRAMKRLLLLCVGTRGFLAVTELSLYSSSELVAASKACTRRERRSQWQRRSSKLWTGAHVRGPYEVNAETKLTLEEENVRETQIEMASRDEEGDDSEDWFAAFGDYIVGCGSHVTWRIWSCIQVFESRHPQQKTNSMREMLVKVEVPLITKPFDRTRDQQNIGSWSQPSYFSLQEQSQSNGKDRYGRDSTDGNRHENIANTRSEHRNEEGSPVDWTTIRRQEGEDEVQQYNLNAMVGHSPGSREVDFDSNWSLVIFDKRTALRRNTRLAFFLKEPETKKTSEDWLGGIVISCGRKEVPQMLQVCKSSFWIAVIPDDNGDEGVEKTSDERMSEGREDCWGWRVAVVPIPRGEVFASVRVG